jgi:hypothetical protein
MEGAELYRSMRSLDCRVVRRIACLLVGRGDRWAFVEVDTEQVSVM